MVGYVESHLAAYLLLTAVAVEVVVAQDRKTESVSASSLHPSACARSWIKSSEFSNPTDTRSTPSLARLRYASVPEAPSLKDPVLSVKVILRQLVSLRSLLDLQFHGVMKLNDAVRKSLHS
jgi:hypothetical protein